jgi:hypothetical protein
MISCSNQSTSSTARRGIKLRECLELVQRMRHVRLHKLHRSYNLRRRCERHVRCTPVHRKAVVEFVHDARFKLKSFYSKSIKPQTDCRLTKFYSENENSYHFCFQIKSAAVHCRKPNLPSLDLLSVGICQLCGCSMKPV